MLTFSQILHVCLRSVILRPISSVERMPPSEKLSSKLIKSDRGIGPYDVTATAPSLGKTVRIPAPSDRRKMKVALRF
jgi:hypothetical protein